MSFVHLHVHSHFSLLDGVLRHDEMAAYAAHHKMPAIAQTDHGNLFGLVDFLKACEKHDIKGIVGCELYLTPSSRLEKNKDAGIYHLTALAMNEVGYHNLIKLVSFAYLEGFYFKPRVDFDLLERYHEGIVVLTGCLKGQVPSYLLMEREDLALEAAERYRDIFGKDNVFIELMSHDLPEENQVLPKLIAFAKKHDFPVVATNDAHYLRSEDAKLQDILLCINTRKQLADTNRMKFSNDNFYLKSPEEMRERFGEVEEALTNTLEIADRAQFRLKSDTYYLPRFEVPPGYSGINHYFEERCREGLKRRLEMNPDRSNPDEAYYERLDMELETIKGMNFPGYFLIVADIINHSKESGIRVGPGRGSAAGSLVSYSLNITDIDPLAYSLLFERFLNRNRISLPDIDIDFAHTGRGKVLDYIRRKFGENNVAQVVTFNTLKAKSVIQDVARVLGLGYQETLAVTKLLTNNATLKESMEENRTFKAIVEENPSLSEVVNYGMRLEGLVRNVSVHAAGVVITPDEVTNYVPLVKTSKGETLTQFDKDRLEELGLLKMDILGLRTLTVIQDTLRSVKALTGEIVDLNAITHDDPAVYALFSEGDTDGVFQFESDGMKRILRQTAPDRIEDLVALNALYRPGAIQGNMVDEYIQRKKGLKPVKFLTEEMEEILTETYGIIVYQEQVMQIAVRVAGFSMSQADRLRKAMGKKRKEIMDAEREPFVQGCIKQGKSKKLANAIFDFIAPFAGYGFNKSHSVAYAHVAYQTAYLKAHYPAHYMAALLTSEIHNTDKISQYISTCEAMGVALLPPDINESDVAFQVAGNGIRFGLEGVKGVGGGSAEEMVAVRSARGRFVGMVDFIAAFSSQGINRKTVEALICAGAFDEIQENRAYLVHHLDTFMKLGGKIREERESGQKSLFGTTARLTDDPPLESVDPWPDIVKLRHELESTGIYLSGHPLEAYHDLLDRYGDTTVKDVANHDGKTVQVGGMVLDLRELKVKSGPNAGKAWARFVLEDLTGTLSCMIFVDVYKREAMKIRSLLEKPVLVKGLVKVEDGISSLMVDEISDLNDAPRRHARGVAIILPEDADEKTLDDLKEFILEHRGDMPVELTVRCVGLYDVVVKPNGAFAINGDVPVIEALESLLGKGSCHLLL